MKVCIYPGVLVIILIMAIFTISESSRTIKIGYSIAEMQEEIKMLLEENKKLEYKSGKLKTLEKISLRVKEMKLNLIDPDNDKGIVIVEKPKKLQSKNLQGRT